MKSLKMFAAAGVLAAIAASCAKENNIKVIVPPDVAELSGVEANTTEACTSIWRLLRP